MKRQLLLSPLNLSATGVGPKIFRPMFFFLVLRVAIQLLLPAVSDFPFIKSEILNNVGWVLVIPGMLFWIGSLVQFLKGFPEGQLITTGVYSISRNPLYVSWILFILPGLAGIFNNWIFLVAAMVMYIAFLIRIPEEEKMLVNAFGDKYTAYSKKVNRLISFPEF